MQPPRPESRISALEALTSTHTAHILELASDTAEGLRDLKQDIKHLSDDMGASFKQSAEYQVEQEHTIEARFDKIEATQNEHSKRFDKLEATQDEHSSLLREQGQKLDLILQLLQKKGE